MKYELKYLSVGELLGKAFNLYFNNFLLLFMVSFAANLTLLLTTRLAILIAGMGEGALTYFLIIIVSVVVTIIPSYFATGLIMLFIARKYLDHPVKFSDVAPTALKLLLPLILLGFLQTLAVMGGIILLIVPGIIFALAFSLSGSVMVVERKGVIESMKRSWELTKGYRGGIFGYQFLIGLINYGFSLLFGLISKTVLSSLVNSGSFFLATLPTIIESSLITPVSSCIFILIYFNLRISKEGFAIEHLTETFSLDSEPSV